MSDDSKLIEVEGSHGELMIDREGYIVSAWHEDPQNPVYDDIHRFDLVDAVRYFGTIKSGYDILSLGYWTKCGKYEEPATDFRKLCEADIDIWLKDIKEREAKQ